MGYFRYLLVVGFVCIAARCCQAQLEQPRDILHSLNDATGMQESGARVYDPADEPQTVSALRAVVSKLVRCNGSWLNEAGINVRWLDSREVNAYADKGNTIYATEGLANLFRQDEAVFLIAREIPKIAVGHPKVSDAGPDPQIRADSDALWLLLGAGLDECAPLATMRRLAVLERESPDLVSEYLGVSPSIEDRATAAKDLLFEVGTGSAHDSTSNTARVLIPVHYIRQAPEKLSHDCQSGPMVLEMARAFSAGPQEVRSTHSLFETGNAQSVAHLLSSADQPTPTDIVTVARMDLHMTHVAKARWTGGPLTEDDPQDLAISALSSDRVWDRNKLYKELASGRPVVLHVNAQNLTDRTYSYPGQHYILVVGCEGEFLICHDPAAGRGGSRYRISDVETAMRAVEYPVIYGFPIPPPYNPTTSLCAVSNLLPTSNCSKRVNVPLIPSKLPTDTCPICRAPKKPGVAIRVGGGQRGRRSWYPRVRPLPVTSVVLSRRAIPPKRKLIPQSTGPDPVYPPRSLVVVEPSRWSMTDTGAASKSIWFKEFVLTKEDLAACSTAKIQIGYLSAHDKSPTVSINRWKAGTLEGVSASWKDYSLSIDTSCLHAGKNLIDIEIDKPDIYKDTGNCDLREVLLLLKSAQSAAPPTKG